MAFLKVRRNAGTTKPTKNDDGKFFGCSSAAVFKIKNAIMLVNLRFYWWS